VSGAALVGMVMICGVVWGGFAALLTRAVRRERARTREGGR
jgi:hypothetical protein